MGAGPALPLPDDSLRWGGAAGKRQRGLLCHVYLPVSLSFSSHSPEHADLSVWKFPCIPSSLAKSSCKCCHLTLTQDSTLDLCAMATISHNHTLLLTMSCGHCWLRAVLKKGWPENSQFLAVWCRPVLFLFWCVNWKGLAPQKAFSSPLQHLRGCSLGTPSSPLSTSPAQLHDRSRTGFAFYRAPLLGDRKLLDVNITFYSTSQNQWQHVSSTKVCLPSLQKSTETWRGGRRAGNSTPKLNTTRV